jgi:hypothetical protein
MTPPSARPRAPGEQAASPQARRFDPQVPHPARVYAYWLGSKDHFPADRKAAEEVAAHRPQVAAGARANRAFLARSVRYLAGQRGVRQFLDIGPGLPAPLAIHEVAQAIAPDSKIVYVDNDPLVMVHARALLTSKTGGTCEHIDGDLRDPDTIVHEAAKTLDFTQPTAVILIAVLHFIPDASDPAGLVASLAGALAPGSFLAILASPGSTLLSWLRLEQPPLVAAVPVTGAMCGSRLMSGSRTSGPGRCGFLRRVSPGRKRISSR